jgi:aryl-alcohol dehydrogenase-like predicted oxidoreductase
VVLTKWCPSPGEIRIRHVMIIIIIIINVSACLCVWMCNDLYDNMYDITRAHMTGEMSEAVVRAAITRALTRLGTTYIDLLQFHWYVVIYTHTHI